MEITLIRHGRSIHTDQTPVTCKELHNWVKKYDGVSIFEEKEYPREAIKKATEANVLLTSDLKRAKDSASFLTKGRQVESHSIFREVDLPIPSGNVFGIKFSPKTWLTLFRILWFCGYSNNNESLSHAQERVKKAAQFLINEARKHESVTVVGHGFFNLLVAKQLKNEGWISENKQSSKHWSCTTYNK
ncbi:broad specificity phosphatase PhoE [Metabacillus crassostreae]|uniref:histidine phosphatase family protein n=1 Tax=Metabacillus crassostreae TaxID=929098 RepID=UPI00195DA254|nr:histidine phosphatase family protein [Metabacillus crassostreae]MBM7605099.1 broad specificity phosphatase PhoE [Metabacillus crassostreae]